ncbi:MAG: TetR/AcrR family transcriptional regulator [Usitatibacter sp.]
MKPLDGNAVRTQRTRSRILAQALGLFNAGGEGNVTTGAIAESLGMSPGNLYYHFSNKDEIVAELLRAFEARMDLEPDLALDAPSAIEDLWLYLHLTLEAIWEFRFIYRNLDDLAARDRRLRERFNRIAERKFHGVVALCEGLVRVKAMRATGEEIRTLARNVLVVATYWLNFESLRGRAAAEEIDLGRGAHQVMSLVAPYLLGDARRHLDRLARNYIE